MSDENATTKNWLQYWRNSLTDSELVSSVPSETEIRSLVEGTRSHNMWFLDRNHIDRGQLDQKTHQQLTKLVAKRKAEHTAVDDKEQTSATIPIIIAPYVYVSNRQHSLALDMKQPALTPLWMIAFVRSDGSLTVPKGGNFSPFWIRRDYQTPNSERIAYCDIDQSDDWLTHHVPDAVNKNWDGYRKSVDTYYTTIGSPRTLMEKYEYSELTTKCVVFACHASMQIIQGILQAYASLINLDKDYPSLLKRYCHPVTSKRSSWWNHSQMINCSDTHLGHMSNEFGLSVSQRQAIYPALTLPEGKILAINGPPGTGKTTLIQDVLASLFVKSAVEEKPPDVLVVASTGNQAVVNVIDCFRDKNATRRWLPKPVDSLGLYLTKTKTKQQEAHNKGVPFSGSSFSGFPSDVQNEVFIGEAEIMFLKEGGKHFKKEYTSTKDVTKQLHKEILLTLSTLKNVESALSAWILEYAELEKLGGEVYLSKQIKNLQHQLQLFNDRRNNLVSTNHAWLVHMEEETLWMTLLYWIPPIGKKILIRDRRFLSEHEQHLQFCIISRSLKSERQDFITTSITAVATCVDKAIESTANKIKVLESLLAPYFKSRKQFQTQLINSNISGVDIISCSNWEETDALEALQRKIDLNLRHKLFELAVHYWEGRWILETQIVLSKSLPNGMFCYSFPEKKREGWQRLAMLTPCFVVTLHSAPTFFQAFDNNKNQIPHTDVIDWLVLDESGQIRPDIAAPTMSVAKRALVVGDTKQLEPIYGITEGIDLANAKKYNITNNYREFINLKEMGMTSSSGSVMKLSQTASSIARKNYEHGVFLAHHRRCYDPIIQFCNKLSYSGRIIPLRGTNKTSFPKMGYVHIKGREEIVGSSRINYAEAATIVQWLIKQKEFIEETYKNDPIGNRIGLLVGIVTPFRSQGNLIRLLLKERLAKLKVNLKSGDYDMFKIGTVDALQGSERRIILFSPVYTTEEKIFFMLDKMPNRLNVAVSRAKDSFLVFGDMEIFDPALPINNPRGILARNLTTALDNVATVSMFSQKITSDMELCSNLIEHRKWLKQAFTDVQKGLLIVSPFLSQKALNDDNITGLIKQTLARGIPVKVIIDDWSTRVPPGSRSTAQLAIDTLKKAGATVCRAHNIHTKLICVDVTYMVLGSFNWLSAERTNQTLIRYDTSMRYRGEKANKLIRMLSKELLKKVITEKNTPDKTYKKTKNIEETGVL